MLDRGSNSPTNMATVVSGLLGWIKTKWKLEAQAAHIGRMEPGVFSVGLSDREGC
jgi:hypothetical protein